jgi:hypothetical protein
VFLLNGAMSCGPWEEDAQITELPHPVTPMKPPGNDGAGHDNSDADISLTQSDEEEESLPKKKRMHLLVTYEVVKKEEQPLPSFFDKESFNPSRLGQTTRLSRDYASC